MILFAQCNIGMSIAKYVPCFGIFLAGPWALIYVSSLPPQWNERLFEEMYLAFRDQRAAADPSDDWYTGVRD